MSIQETNSPDPLLSHSYNLCGVNYNYEFEKPFMNKIKIIKEITSCNSTIRKDYYVSLRNSHIENKVNNGLEVSIGTTIFVLVLMISTIIGILMGFIDLGLTLIYGFYTIVVSFILYICYLWKVRNYLQISDNTGFSLRIHRLDNDKKADIIELFN